MATTFLEPGGDATFDFTLWRGVSDATIVSDIVHGSHLRSIKILPNDFCDVVTPTNVVSDAGGRISFWVYVVARPTATGTIISASQNGGGTNFSLAMTSAGVLQLLNSGGTQMGSNGATIPTATWTRISMSWVITSSTVNNINVYVNGTSSINSVNNTIGSTTTGTFFIGNMSTDLTLALRLSDFFIDNSSANTDPGNIWVTAKRPVSNGTTNGFTTQIGSGGSGYGTGHAPQVNERPLSVTNGWSMIGAGSAITEEYTIEAQNVGDIDISGGTIVDYMGWAFAKALVSETGQIILNSVNSNIALTSTNTAFLVAAGSTTYPNGGEDIGIITSTALTTVSLYECGVMVAYIPAGPPTTLAVSDSTAISDSPTLVIGQPSVLINSLPAMIQGVRIIGP